MLLNKRIVLFLFIGLLTVFVGIIPELISDELKAWCLEQFGSDDPWYFTGFFVVACFVLLALSEEFKKLLSLNRKVRQGKPARFAWSETGQACITTAKKHIAQDKLEAAIATLHDIQNPQVEEELTLLSGRLESLRRKARNGTLSYEEETTGLNRIRESLLSFVTNLEAQIAEAQKEYRQVRDALQMRYRQRLQQKMAHRQPVNLRRLVSTRGTSPIVAETFVTYDTLEISEEIGKTFQEAFGRLLIVGEPGSGKTTLLLKLAERLFELEADALPLVINLASWQTNFGTLDNWLSAVLADELSTTKAGARAVLNQSRIILLLDGLDELKEDEAINSCLAAIADYGGEPGRRFVITCRMAEYERAQEDARVNLQIEVGPLTGAQLEAELTRIGRTQPEMLPLLQAIRRDPLLRQAAETPFYFNTLQLLFAGQLPVFSAGDLDGRLAEITEKFVEKALHNTHKMKYPPVDAAHWLSFLALRMNQRNKVVFELRDLQYDWWGKWSRWNLFWAHFIDGPHYVLVFGFIYGIIYGMMGGVIHGLIYGFAGSLVGALVGSLIFGIFVLQIGGHMPGIDTKDRVFWSPKGLLLFVYKNIVVVFLVALTIGLISGLDQRMTTVLVFGVSTALAFWLVERINDHTRDFIQIRTPYQRFTASMKVLHFSILQHFHLRYLLYKKGLLPFRLVDFLNEMTSLHLLETDGATWRFRHRIIQEYFAAKWKDPGSGEAQTKLSHETSTSPNFGHRNPKSKGFS